MKYSFLKRKFVLLILFTLIFSFSFIVQVYASQLSNYPAQKQSQTNWCWAASSTSIIKYLKDRIVTQCTFVNTVKGTTQCANEGGSVTEAQRGLSSYSVSSTYYNGSLTGTELKSQFSASSPVYVSWGWSSGGGHAVVATGYWSFDGMHYVSYMDPWDGVNTSMAYANFKGGSGYDRTWRWGLKDTK